MATELTNMEIDEISIVDDPANELARAVIVKAKGGKKPTVDPEEADENGVKDDEAAEAAASGHPPGKPRNKMAAAIEKALNEIAPRLAQAVVEGNSTDFDASATAHATHKEYDMDLEALSKALEGAEAKLETLEKRAEAAEAALAEASEVIKSKDAELAAVAKSAGGGEDDEEAILKSLPDSIRKRLADADAAAKEATEKLEKAKADAEENEAISKAKALGFGDATEVGKLLVRVSKGKTTVDDTAVIERLLKSASEVAKNGKLFATIGSDAASDAGNPDEVLKAKAAEIQKNAGGKLSFEQAYDKALEENPAIYKEYIAKRRAS